MLMAMTVLQVDIVIPVRNEERDLAPSVRRLVSYLREGFPFTARVTIADSGSADGTWAIANRLARDFDEVRAVRAHRPHLVEIPGQPVGDGPGTVGAAAVRDRDPRGER